MTFLKNYNLDKVNSYIFGLYGLFISLSVSISGFLAYLMLIILLINGNLKEKISELKSNPFIYAVIGFVVIHFLGLLWTDDLSWAYKTIKREWKLLFIVFFMMIVRKEHFKYYLKCFIVGMSISEVVSYAIWFGIIPPFMNATLEMPSPFIKHLNYTVYLAMAIYLLLHFVVLEYRLHNKQKWFVIVFVITMVINLFITGGRAGQIAFIVLLMVLSFSLIREHFKISVALVLGGLFSIVIAYNTSSLFFDRANKAVNEIVHFTKDHNTSVGTRIALAINTFELIKQNPFLGVGTGDLLIEYEKVNTKSQYKTPVMHPHNMYLLMLAEFGLVGLIVLLSLFYSKVKIAFLIDDEFKNMRFAFSALFFVILFSNSYLYTHHTMVLYIFFSAFLFKVPDFKAIKIKE